MKSKNKPDHSQALVLDEQIQFVEGGIASRTLIDKKPGTITLFAFDDGQGLSEHQAPYDAFVQVLFGELEVVIDNKPILVKAGQIAILPANVPHSVRALAQSKMLLVMIRG